MSFYSPIDPPRDWKPTNSGLPSREELMRFASLEEAEASVKIDFGAIMRALKRNRVLIIATLAAGALIGVASILLTRPTYRAEASVQIDSATAKVLNSEDLEPLVSGPETERLIQTEINVVRSRTLAASVADSVRLNNDSDFLISDASKGDRKQQVVDKLLENLKVDLLPNSRVVRISYEDGNAARAAQIANSFADKLIKTNLQRRFATSAYSRQFLGGQLAEAKARLESAERATIAYARNAHLIDASEGATRANEVGTKSLTTANLVTLNDAYSTARASRIQAQQKWQQAQGAAITSLPEVLSNPAIQVLNQRRAELKVQYQEERQRHKPDYPTVGQLSAKIAQVDREIATLSGSIRSSINDQYQITARQEKALEGDVSKLKEATLAEQDRSVQYNILKRETDTSRAMYDALLQRYKELSAAAGISNNNITIIDRAFTPVSPVRPNAIINLAIAMLGALALALLGVFGRERFVDQVHDAEDVRRGLDLSLLGAVPMLKGGKSPQIALSNQRSAFSEAHASICSALKFTTNAGMPRSIMLTSSRPAEGKSTTALSLAVSLAREGKKVVLIDSDLRRPSLHRLLAQSNNVGLVHLLTGQKQIDEVAFDTGLPGLMFIATGPLPPNPSALLSGDALPALLADLAERYDIVIIDAPPVLGLADAPRLSSVVDATLFVIEADGARMRMLQRALQRLIIGHARVAGAILTKFETGLRADAMYSYDYGYSTDEAEDAGVSVTEPISPTKHVLEPAA